MAQKISFNYFDFWVSQLIINGIDWTLSFFPYVSEIFRPIKPSLTSSWELITILQSQIHFLYGKSARSTLYNLSIAITINFRRKRPKKTIRDSQPVHEKFCHDKSIDKLVFDTIAEHSVHDDRRKNSGPIKA